MNPAVSRRDFLKLAAFSLGSLGLKPWQRLLALPDFPPHERLGRVTVGKIDLKARPDEASETVGVLYEDAVVPWLKETVGPRPYRNNQHWVETPDGYLWSAQIQPVWNQPNTPVNVLPQTSLGPGMWVEVSVPYVDLILDNPPARAIWLQNQLASGLPHFRNEIGAAGNGAGTQRSHPGHRNVSTPDIGNLFSGTSQIWRFAAICIWKNNPGCSKVT